MRYRVMLPLLILTLMLGACAGPGTLERRAGYAVDHSQVAPSHNSRVRHLVLHYTDGDEAEALATLTGPRVSSHYVLPRGPRGRVYQLVDESRRAWHAGASRWKGGSDLNASSIGIEIVNAGPDRTAAEVERLLATDRAGAIAWAPYPEEQLSTLIALSRDIIDRHGIEATNVVAHSDIAPMRKIDPGPAFPWRRLHEAGIGPWPEPSAVARWRTRFEGESPSLARLQEGLAAWGYGLAITGEADPPTRAVLRAFQMRFRPADYRGLPDAETAAILWALLERYRPEALPGR
ncbi:N-acetylmuramoyl-L-alanine amidase [Halomonas saccharevitans]|uniref:N-acetylmuramoyl-L-alanine amidase n=1 Tax=Halomonas saccharevitans TaxID=416872 RepID=A0A1I6X654_9GAMM|nr:N-acetylmuramoyl-L-alanine amidase [Halomonas saccharevitans]SFT33697.1 N-acetylmuramoyl-L-alanine amidase [Halomonas saccharevitans]